MFSPPLAFSLMMQQQLRWTVLGPSQTLGTARRCVAAGCRCFGTKLFLLRRMAGRRATSRMARRPPCVAIPPRAVCFVFFFQSQSDAYMHACVFCCSGGEGDLGFVVGGACAIYVCSNNYNWQASKGIPNFEKPAVPGARMMMMMMCFPGM